MDLISTFRTSTLRSAYESYDNPRINDGSYLSEEHRHQLLEQSEIVHWDEYAKPTYIEGVGTFRQVGFITRQGYEYAARIGIPENPDPTNNIPVIGTTAYCTGLIGFNDETVHNFTKDGHYTIRVSGEGGFRSQQAPEPESPITLANSAAATLGFARDYVQCLIDEGHPVDAKRRIVEGGSRGGMVGFGITSLAQDFEQNVISLEALAPRFPEKLSLPKTIKLFQQIGKETLHLTTLPLSLGPCRSIRYLPSTDLHPHALKHYPEIFGALTSGEAGLLGAAIDRNHSYLNIATFSNDGSDELPGWKRKFWAHPGVNYETINGWHLDIPLKSVQHPIRQRVGAIRACAKQDIPVTMENVSEMRNELSRVKHPLGRRALRFAG